MKSSFFLLIFYNVCLTTISCCHSDRNMDHRPRVNCTAMTLSSVPSSIDPAIEVIVLADNDFVSLAWSSYQSFHKLHELDLSRNKVSALQSTSNMILPSLRVLWLSGNRLQELPASAFTAASKLMEIYLRANQLHTLNQDTFKDLEQLEVLDLSQNLIQVLPLPLLTVISTKILKTFDVEDNRLKVMPDQFFSKLPDIPYVYLSKNPWVCNCDVGYLSRWLEDQGHNVYVHTGPSNIVNDPESVLCDSPNQLKDRAIIDLTEDEYCASLGDGAYIVNAASHTSAATTWTLSTAHSLPPTQTPEVTQTSTVFNNQADTSAPALTLTTTSTQTTITTPIQTSANTPIPTTGKTLTSIRTTIPTQTPTTSGRTFSFLTTMHYLIWTSWYDFSKTSLESVMKEESSTISAAFQLPTTVFKSTAQFTTQSTPRLTTPLKTQSTTTSAPQSTRPSTPAQHPTTSDPSWTTKQSVSTSYVGIGSKVQERPVVYYCWWLFLGYLFLCIILIFWLCFFFLRALRAYLRVYLPLVRKKQERRRNTLRLLGYYTRQMADTDGNGENLQSRGKASYQAGAISLPFEDGEGVQAIFRSVLFVHRPEQTKEGEEECEGVKPEYTRQDCTTGPDAGSLDIGSVENMQVHRKTIYKVVRREQELTGLTEVDLSQRANDRVPNEQGKRVTQGWSEGNRTSSEHKKRYSLILREERVNGEERDRSINRESSIGNEWIVGEWLLKDQEGAAADTREEDWWSLIPLIARGTDPSPRGGDGSSPPKIIISETQL